MASIKEIFFMIESTFVTFLNKKIKRYGIIVWLTTVYLWNKIYEFPTQNVAKFGMWSSFENQSSKTYMAKLRPAKIFLWSLKQTLGVALSHNFVRKHLD